MAKSWSRSAVGLLQQVPGTVPGPLCVGMAIDAVSIVIVSGFRSPDGWSAHCEPIFAQSGQYFDAPNGYASWISARVWSTREGAC